MSIQELYDIADAAEHLLLKVRQAIASPSKLELSCHCGESDGEAVYSNGALVLPAGWTWHVFRRDNGCLSFEFTCPACEERS